MNHYTAKYYPLVNGKETEYTTTVEAKNKKDAELAVRRAFIERFESLNYMVTRLGLEVVGYDIGDISKDIEYAKKNMRILIY